MLGPGIVWMALAQGSGELIWWPYIVAKYGLTFLFLLLPACLIQYPMNVEIGRYTVLTGESIYQGFLRMSRPYTIVIWILMTVSFAWFGAFASAGGTALAALTNFPGSFSPSARSLFWGYSTIALYLTALLVSRVVYRVIEKFMAAIAVITLVGLGVSAFHPDVREYLPAFLKGLFVPMDNIKLEPADAEPLLTAITFAGLGGFWITFYSYWLREKGAGMAGNMGRIAGLMGRQEVIPESGFIPDDKADQITLGRQWVKYLQIDAIIGPVGNILTTILTCLLAYSLLRPSGILPQGNELASAQARFFEVSWGVPGRILFLIVAAAFLSDTWMATVDAVARIQTDLVFQVFPRARQLFPIQRWYFIFIGIFTVVTCLTMSLAQPAELILTSAVIGFAGTVLLAFGLLVLNFKTLAPHLPPALRPSRLSFVLLLVTCVCYTGLALAYGWVKLTW